MKERIIFECEHCRKKRLLSKYQMRDHEDICWYNTENQSCKTCKHIDNKHPVQHCYIGIELEDFPKPNVNCGAWEIRKELEED